MPLYKSVSIDRDTQLLIWKITESEQELYNQVKLKDMCTYRIGKMKSEQHRRAFLSVRMLMQHIGYTDFDMYYGEDGKPHLYDGKNISITHSYQFAAIIVSSRNVGIDMEIRREKVIRIADKFIDNEFAFLEPAHLTEYVRSLIVIWGVKEALFKMFSREGLSFKQHIEVHPFDTEAGEGTAAVNFNDINGIYNFCFQEIEDFTLVYTIDPNTPLQ
jgi:4'-phosphopantetheinyl transferase